MNLTQISMPSVNGNVVLATLKDESYLVGLESAIGKDPELCVGCIGQWVNTDDEAFANILFNALIKTDVILTVDNSVSKALEFRERVLDVANITHKDR